MRTIDDQNKAWGILTEDEKTAITLNLGVGKSTWSASDIMGKSHYKYLEILERAKKIFKMFQEYFEKYGDYLIPVGVEVDEDFERYLEAVIIDRMKIREAMKELKDARYISQADRESLVNKNMAKLKSYNTDSANDLIDLIKEFDRWNNHRILPVELQEPHAFKRRNKKRIQRYLNNLLELEDWLVMSIVKNYSLKTPRGDSLYFALPQNKKLELSKIIIIKRDEVAIKRFTDAGLFLFTQADHAKEFLEIVTDYFSKEERHCKEGQVFWPRLRVVISKAINFNEIERIAPNRKNLQEATKNLDKAITRKYHEKKGKEVV